MTQYVKADCPKCDRGWLPGDRPGTWRLCTCNMGIIMVPVAGPTLSDLDAGIRQIDKLMAEMQNIIGRSWSGRTPPEPEGQ
jgi:hypothetical protein